MADPHSILYRGADPLSHRPQPKRDNTKKVQRYWRGKAPAWADEESDPAARDETEKRQQAPEPIVEPVTHIVDRRLQRLQLAEVAASSDARQEATAARRRRIQEAKVLSSASSSREVPRPVEGRPEAALAASNVVKEESVAERRARVREAALTSRKEDAPDSDSDDVASSANSEAGDGSDIEGDKADEAVSEDVEPIDDEPYEVPPPPRIRPLFVSKAKRATIAERERLEEEEEAQREAEAEKVENRKVESKELLVETIKQEEEEAKLQAEALAAAQDGNLSDKELPSDGDDEERSEEEYEAWKLRELKRLVRDRHDRLARRLEAEIVERRRHMTPEERKQDDARIDALFPQQEKSKQFGFMQKYYHKGAFFQDLAQEGKEELYLRDFQTPTADDAVDRSALPAPMQLRRGQFGIASRSKYTHLTDQDTTDKTSAWAKRSEADVKKMAGLKSKDELDKPLSKKRKL